MVSTAGDASLLTSTVLIKLKLEIISESVFPFDNLIRYNDIYLKAHKPTTISINCVYSGINHASPAVSSFILFIAI